MLYGPTINGGLGRWCNLCGDRRHAEGPLRSQLIIRYEKPAVRAPKVIVALTGIEDQ